MKLAYSLQIMRVKPSLQQVPIPASCIAVDTRRHQPLRLYAYEGGANPAGAELCIFFCNRKFLNPDTFLSKSVVFLRLNLAPGSAVDDPAVARGATRRLSVASGMLSGLLIWESMVNDGVLATGR
jgi:hypothetical protein